MINIKVHCTAYLFQGTVKRKLEPVRAGFGQSSGRSRQGANSSQGYFTLPLFLDSVRRQC